MRYHKSTPEVISRLAKIEGHIRAIRRMAEEGKGCEELLMQLAAVRSAVTGVSRLVLEDHLDGCILESVEEGKGQESIERFKSALARFM